MQDKFCLQENRSFSRKMRKVWTIISFHHLTWDSSSRHCCYYSFGLVVVFVGGRRWHMSEILLITQSFLLLSRCQKPGMPGRPLWCLDLQSGYTPLGLPLIILNLTATQEILTLRRKEPGSIAMMLCLCVSFYPLHDTAASLSNPLFKHAIKCWRSHTLSSFPFVSSIFH